MRVTHRLVGYDQTTDRPRRSFEIPEALLEHAKRIAHVPDDDSGAAWSYALSEAQARGLADLTGANLDPGTEYVLEAFLNPVPAKARRQKSATGG